MNIIKRPLCRNFIGWLGGFSLLMAIVLFRPHAPEMEGSRQSESDMQPASSAARVDAVESNLISRFVFDSLPTAQQTLMLERARAIALDGPPVQACFSPGTPNDVVNAFQNALFPNPAQRFQGTVQWGETATNGSGLPRGEPITLTYSFVPDGTLIPSGVGEPPGFSNLFATLDALYGDTATWQALYAQVFDRWSELCGITYVFEPNDDGATFSSSPGVLGVRGDLRMAGKLIDGNPVGGSILAYNFFPDVGDMVIDTADGFFTDLSANSLKLRNVLSHEHGHGMGAAHVCPLSQTKLMEPFASTAFDGPQHDEIRGAQWRYGDPFEPDNTPATATDVGTLPSGASVSIGDVPLPSVQDGAILSIDANGEQDYFRFTTIGPVKARVVLRPVGLLYDDSPQDAFQCPDEPANCCSGNFTDSNIVANLDMEIIGPNGSTVLARANAAAAGASERLSNILLPAAGNYFVRVFESGNATSRPQLYKLDVSVAFQPMEITLPSGPPSSLASGAATTFDVRITSNDDTVLSGSETLFYRFDDGAFLSAPMTHVAGEMYTATLPPADCLDDPQFFLSASGTLNGNVQEPAGGPSDPHLAFVVSGPDLVFTDNFETNQGWTVSGDATDGQWERGVPVNGGLGDPPSDQDGSGQAFVTDNVAGDSDVEEGTTILTSPVFDLSTGGTVSFAYWLNDAPSPVPPGSTGDSLTVEVATDAAGTNWQLVRTYTDNAPAWRTDAIAISPTATARVRFSASDLSPPSIVEAGIDAVQVNRVKCIPPAPLGLAASDGELCGTVRLSWDNVADAMTYEVWRNVVNDPATAARLVDGLTVAMFDDDTAQADAVFFYWVTAVGGTGASAFSDTDTGFTRRLEPAAPTGVAATLNTVCGEVTVTWEAVDIASSYEVWRQAVGDADPAIRIAADIPDTAFTDTTAAAGTTYFYWARAVNACGSGDFSETVIGSTATVAPSAPTGLNATDGTVCGSVRVSWDPAEGVASYLVWRNATEDPAAAVQVGEVASTFFNDDTVEMGATFFYWVTATNGCGVSGFSNADMGTAGVGQPDCAGSGVAPFTTTADCADGLCATGMGTALPIMLIGCWFIRRKHRSRRRP